MTRLHSLNARIWSDGLAAGLLAATIAFLPDWVRASEPVALVMAVEGETSPQVTSFSELERGQRIALDPNSELSFVHYGTCREVTVRGGTLLLFSRAFDLSGGRVLSERQEPCPQEVSLANGGIAAGLVLRNAGSVRTSTAPEFFLVGTQARRLIQMTVHRKEAQPVPLRIEGQRLFWPDEVTPLDTEKTYSAELTLDGGDPLRFTFSPTAGRNVGAIVIRID